jgi:hypothetical protein
MFKENLAIFFNPKEFGTPAVFSLPDGSEFGFDVIFDDAFLNPQTGLLSLETTSPEAACRWDKVEELREIVRQGNGGSDILANQTIPLRSLLARFPEASPGKKYSILEVRPDISGTAVIILANE